ncbi:MAG: DNA-directed RNA polymerase subunit omega [Ectothiorhodospiraceae bacterium]|nr:MAG: DNA-directed RNA polymerase subunit omega [Ectothiorhodospiraceae bacterium]
MARVTIEDCIKEVDNTFDICCIASKRARDISQGAELLLESKNKPTVAALREIAAKKVSMDYNDISNKQSAETKLFGGITESEVLEELNQHIEASDPAKDNQTVTEASNITGETITAEAQITTESTSVTSEPNSNSDNDVEVELPSELEK